MSRFELTNESVKNISEYLKAKSMVDLLSILNKDKEDGETRNLYNEKEMSEVLMFLLNQRYVEVWNLLLDVLNVDDNGKLGMKSVPEAVTPEVVVHPEDTNIDGVKK